MLYLCSLVYSWSLLSYRCLRSTRLLPTTSLVCCSCALCLSVAELSCVLFFSCTLLVCLSSWCTPVAAICSCETSGNNAINLIHLQWSCYWSFIACGHSYLIWWQKKLLIIHWIIMHAIYFLLTLQYSLNLGLIMPTRVTDDTS